MHNHRDEILKALQEDDIDFVILGAEGRKVGLVVINPTITIEVLAYALLNIANELLDTVEHIHKEAEKN